MSAQIKIVDVPTSFDRRIRPPPMATKYFWSWSQLDNLKRLNNFKHLRGILY